MELNIIPIKKLKKIRLLWLFYGNFLFAVLFPYTLFSQVCAPYSLGADTMFCGNNFTLNAPPGFTNYTWNNGSTSSSIYVSQTGNYWVSSIDTNQNAVTNGDFQAGANSFTSAYVPGTGGPFGLLSFEGTYAVATSPSLVHNNFPACGDHTTGTGNMLIVNGAGITNQAVWQQTVTVQPGMFYHFSMWFTSVSPASPGMLRFSINNIDIGPIFTLSSNTCFWQTFSTNWFSGTSTTAIISVTNQNTAASGNDFAIDDILFSPICQLSDTIFLTKLNVPNVFISGNDTICQDDSTLLIANSNVPNCTFNWSQGSLDTLQISVNPNINTSYTVTAIDSLGCAATSAPFPVKVFPNPVLTVNFNDTICLGDSLNIIASSSVPNTQFNWTPNLSNNHEASLLITNDTLILLQAVSPIGCLSEIDSIPITKADLPTAQIQKTRVNCLGSNDGTVTFTPQTGYSPFSLDFNGVNYQNNLFVQNLDSGWYNFTFSDRYNCSFSDSVFINPPVPFAYDFSFYGNLCLNENKLFVEAQNLNQTDTSATIFNWNFGDNALNYFGFATQYTYSQSGNYDINLIVENSFGCVDTIVKNVTIYETPIADFNFINACKTSPVQLLGNSFIPGNSFGDSLVTFIWDYGENTGLAFGKNTQHYYQNAGLYDVKLISISAFGCRDTVIKEVETYALPIAQFNVANVCEGQKTVFHDVSEVFNGSTIQSWFWQFDVNENLASSSLENPMYEYKEAGNYGAYLKIKTNQGCEDSVYKNIEVNHLPEIKFRVNQLKSCPPFLVEIIDSSTVEQSFIKSYFKQIGNNTEENQNLQLELNESGFYDLYLSAESAFGCKSDTFLANYFEVFPKPIADFDILPPWQPSISAQFEFLNESLLADTYSWKIGPDLFFPKPELVNQNIQLFTEGNYWVQLLAKNQFGCVDSLQKELTVETDFALYIPNSFSPGDNDLNNVFKAYGAGVVHFDMQIFERWGSVIFSSNDLTIGWNGKLANTDDFYPQGIYTYKIIALDKYGKTHEYLGHLNLIR